MRSHVPVSVSLPPDLFAAAEKRAAQLGFRRATYIQQLILADLRRQKDEGKGPTVYLPPLSSSGKAPGAGARKGAAKKASAGRKAPAKAARKPAAKKRR